MAKQSIRKFKKLLKGGSRAKMTAPDWAEVRDMLGRDAGLGVKRKARSNPPKHKGKSITLRNMKSVTITRNSNGTVSVKGTRKKSR